MFSNIANFSFTSRKIKRL